MKFSLCTTALCSATAVLGMTAMATAQNSMSNDRGANAQTVDTQLTTNKGEASQVLPIGGGCAEFQCATDITGDGQTNTADLLELLANWGPCPEFGPEGATPEGEECGEDTNGGCNSLGACEGKSGDCCIANGSPGCEDATCQDAICALDAFCCDTTWDTLCAEAACDNPECQCEPAGGDPFGAIECGETVSGTVWAEPDDTGLGQRDTDWFEFTVEAQTQVTATLVSEGPVAAFIATGVCPPVIIGTTGAGNNCASIVPASACLDAGTYYLIILPGNPDGTGVFEGYPCDDSVCGANDYFVTLECEAPCPPIACCFSDGSCENLLEPDCLAAGGTPQGGGTACETVDCPTICGEGAGDCCISNGTPGCEDPECCDAVCGVDPFCCDTTWDGLCADAAAGLCPACEVDLDCPGEGDCCAPNGTVGCEDTECCELVCTNDSFCCETEWDQLCADQANDLCDVCAVPVECPGDGGDCCAPNGTPGCDDLACCELICGNDPFCCETEWDQLCTDAAVIECAVCN